LASASGWQDWLVRRQDAASFPGYAALAFCSLEKSRQQVITAVQEAIFQFFIPAKRPLY
jgi:hypothetical protein